MQSPDPGESHPCIHGSWRWQILLWLKNGLGFLSRYQLVTGLGVLFSEDNEVLTPNFTQKEEKRNHHKKASTGDIFHRQNLKKIKINQTNNNNKKHGHCPFLDENVKPRLFYVNYLIF